MGEGRGEVGSRGKERERERERWRRGGEGEVRKGS